MRHDATAIREILSRNTWWEWVDLAQAAAAPPKPAAALVVPLHRSPAPERQHRTIHLTGVAAVPRCGDRAGGWPAAGPFNDAGWGLVGSLPRAVKSRL